MAFCLKAQVGTWPKLHNREHLARFPSEMFPVIEHVQRFRRGLVFKAHRLCVSLNSRLESNKEEEEEGPLPSPVT